MKGGLVIVLCLALICSLTAGLRVDTNQTLSEVLTTDYSEFAKALSTKLPAVWNEIVNAPSTNEGEFTVFAPSNGVIKGNPTPDVLAYHIVRREYVKQALTQYSTLPTLYNATGLNNQSQVLAFTVSSNGTVTINGERTILGADFVAKNGLIHNISGVLSLPQNNVYEIVKSDYSQLSSLFKIVNLTLNNVNDITLLAPTDAAFNNLFAQAPLLKSFIYGGYPSTSKFIADILEAHVVTKAFYPSTLVNGSNAFTSIAGAAVNVSKNGVTGAVSIIDPRGQVEANVVQPNILATNGVVHGIDSVLAYGVGLNLRQTIEALNATTFLSALNTTGLGSLLLEDNSYTIFVPTNEALKGLSVNASNIEYHVSSFKNVAFTNTFAPTLLNLTSLGGEAQELYASNMRHNGSNITAQFVNGIRVTGPFITLRQTYVYLINSVLSLPPPVATALKNGNFSDLVGLLSEKQINTTGLFNINSPRVTVFAPTTEAFNKLPIGVVGYLRLTTGDSPKVAQSVLNNHIIPNTTIYTFPSSAYYTTAQNNTIRVSTNVNGVVINNGSVDVDRAGILTENGIAYPVNSLILPPGLEFNALDILRGLPADGSDAEFGNYTTTIRHLRNTGLISLLTTNESFILFPPTNAAWDKATERFEDGVNATINDLDRLRSILNLHIVYGSDVVKYVNNSVVYRPGNLTNTTIELINHGADKSEVQLRNGNDTLITSASVVVNTTSTYGQRIYGVDKVLGVGIESTGSHGLSTLEWVLIGVGGAVLGLIILLVIAGAAYYLLVRPDNGYRQIN